MTIISQIGNNGGTSASYGAFTHRRLQAVKRRMDPANVIRANHAL